MTSWRIGIAGPIAAGKSLVSNYIAEKFRLTHIDADKIGHQVLDNPLIKQQLLAMFPEIENTHSQKIDRSLLSQIVFQNPNHLLQLNGITWPFIIKQIEQLVEEYPRCVIEAIGLFKSNLDTLCHHTLYIDSSSSVIRERLQKRNYSPEKIENILDQQAEYGCYAKNADALITNESTIEVLLTFVEQFIKTWAEKDGICLGSFSHHEKSKP